MHIAKSRMVPVGVLAAMIAGTMVVPADAETRTFQCRLPDRSATQRIVGGQNARHQQFPWQVSIARRGRDPHKGHFCGGVLIGRQWVLTAAHCMVRKSPGSLVIRHGITNLRSRSGAVERGVARIFIHPAYTKGPNDVALIKLDAPIEGVNKSYATLPRSRIAPRFIFPEACAVVTGWGRMTQGGSIPSQLRAVSIPIIDQQKCRKAYAVIGIKVAEVDICAGLALGGRDSCQGDSGGPLVVEGGPTGFVLAGIVSRGKGCAKAGYYGIYARVSSFIPWIVKTIRSN